jgi:hypothetical protein
MPTSNEETKVFEEIHKNVDTDLVDFLAKALKTQGQMSTSKVASTLAYMIAEALTQSGKLSGKEVCRITTAYGEYIHQTAHWMVVYDEENNGKNATRQ